MNQSDMQPQRTTIKKFAKQILQAEKLVIVCGAGLSYGSAPLAQAIEDGLLAALVRLAYEGSEIDLHVASQAAIEVRQPYMTLELFVSGLRQRIPDLGKPLEHLYGKIFDIPDNRRSRAHGALANALSVLKEVVVLTSNFDDGLTGALRSVGTQYHLVTDANVRQANLDRATGKSARIEVCAYHGTVDPASTDAIKPTPPTSMAARDLAHPFRTEMSTYVRSVLEAAANHESGLILFVGHRGEDFYDLNLEIQIVLGGSKDPQKLKRFVCIPHLGDLSSVSSFYESTFTQSGLVILVDGEENWLPSLFDMVADKKTSEVAVSKIDADIIEREFLSIINDLCESGVLRKQVLTRQAKALISEINAGLLAAWSVAEHYRLESLAYTQEQISAFARPPKWRLFEGLKIDQLLALQRDYQEFRASFEKQIDLRDTRKVAGEGATLSIRLEEFGAAARRALAHSVSPMNNAMAALLAAIAYDYAGLTAMRLMRTQLPPGDKNTPLGADLLSVLEALENSALATGQEKRAEQFFLASAGLAKYAGAQITKAAEADESDPARSAKYAASLAQIIGWEDWVLAPAENRLRLPNIPVDEKLAGFEFFITERINRIRDEMNKPIGEKSFSAAGDAAQCAQRLAELMRFICGKIGEEGLVDPTKFAKGQDVERIVGKVPELAGECLKAGHETSSLPNYRFLSAYDALVLAALYEKRNADADNWIAKAEAYAKAPGATRADFAKRFEQVRSRRP